MTRRRASGFSGGCSSQAVATRLLVFVRCLASRATNLLTQCALPFGCLRTVTVACAVRLQLPVTPQIVGAGSVGAAIRLSRHLLPSDKRLQ